MATASCILHHAFEYFHWTVGGKQRPQQIMQKHIIGSFALHRFASPQGCSAASVKVGLWGFEGLGASVCKGLV
jgi:hypothetical protein